MFEATADEIVRCFTQWEYGAARSGNPKVSQSAPLDAPTLQAAAALVPRLVEFRQRLGASDRDWHGRSLSGVNLDMAALGWLWEEWRDDRLGVSNGYQDVWSEWPDPLYDGTSRNRPAAGSGG